MCDVGFCEGDSGENLFRLSDEGRRAPHGLTASATAPDRGVTRPRDERPDTTHTGDTSQSKVENRAGRREPSSRSRRRSPFCEYSDDITRGQVLQKPNTRIGEPEEKAEAHMSDYT
ncbi:hypothetical protein EYF80_059732 [Liparis tanakae]|uniref:Uncharacterized protein n=1 Tax=Liparis tanakae TaxID=230148 RepID=A0A4Z2EMK4_9TELE|nr:hypothetical protein EYF80_059732 [Liparis tanakae]